MKVAFIGSRSIKEADIGAFLPKETTLLLSGGAVGVDTLAEQYAKSHGIETCILRPNYQAYGKAAPLLRNRELVLRADCIIALWDGVSRGTIYTVKYAKAQNKPVRLFRLTR